MEKKEGAYWYFEGNNYLAVIVCYVVEMIKKGLQKDYLEFAFDLYSIHHAELFQDESLFWTTMKNDGARYV